MTHCTKVVDFSGSDISDDGNQIGSITKISVRMKEEFHSGFVSVSVDVVDSASVEGRGTTNDSMDL